MPNKKKKHNLKYQDSFNVVHTVAFNDFEYMNLMEMLWDQTIEEWGDCKGRAQCGTCHISMDSKKSRSSIMTNDEEHCLANQSNRNQKSRLACQIMIRASLAGAFIKYISAT